MFTQQQMSPGAECSLMKDSKYKGHISFHGHKSNASGDSDFIGRYKHNYLGDLLKI